MSEAGKLVFPTEFPIKVMGRDDSDMRAITRRIVEKHAGLLQEDQIRERPSAAGKFLSLTFVIQAKSQEQLDNIYRELTASGVVLMAL